MIDFQEINNEIIAILRSINNLFLVYSIIFLLAQFSCRFSFLTIHISDAVEFMTFKYIYIYKHYILSDISDISFDFYVICQNISSLISHGLFLLPSPRRFLCIILSAVKQVLIWRLLSGLCNADSTAFSRASCCNYVLWLCKSFNKTHTSADSGLFTNQWLLHSSTQLRPVSHKLSRS